MRQGLPHVAAPRLSPNPVLFFIGLKSDAIACRRSAAIEKAQHQNLRVVPVFVAHHLAANQLHDHRVGFIVSQFAFGAVC